MRTCEGLDWVTGSTIRNDESRSEGKGGVGELLCISNDCGCRDPTISLRILKLSTEKEASVSWDAHNSQVVQSSQLQSLTRTLTCFLLKYCNLSFQQNSGRTFPNVSSLCLVLTANISFVQIPDMVSL